MNEQGMTLIETILSIAILSLLAMTLIPFANQLQSRVFDQKIAYYASEVAYNGVKQVVTTGVTQGTITIENLDYNWRYEHGEICVEYSNWKGPQLMCIKSDGIIEEAKMALHL
ncbi:type II secretion system protein [Lysinibacillus sp. KU-BSD001]|uniref:type II secretion system protein n=1 Tax=Lysinibacillus sp. KU-BSD001 TaxID=3141328 RepID=UPI0036E83EA2